MYVHVLIRMAAEPNGKPVELETKVVIPTTATTDFRRGAAMSKPLRNALKNAHRRGVALLLAMGAVVILMVMLTEFQESDQCRTCWQRSPIATPCKRSTLPRAA